MSEVRKSSSELPKLKFYETSELTNFRNFRIYETSELTNFRTSELPKVSEVFPSELSEVSEVFHPNFRKFRKFSSEHPKVSEVSIRSFGSFHPNFRKFRKFSSEHPKVSEVFIRTSESFHPNYRNFSSSRPKLSLSHCLLICIDFSFLIRLIFISNVLPHLN